MNTSLKTLVCLASLVASPAVHAAVVVPYTNNFSSDPAGVFTTSSDIKSGASGSIGWNSTNQTYQSTLTDASFGNVNSLWSTVAASNLNAGVSNFYLSSTFKVDSNSSAGGMASVGLGASSVTNFPTFSAGNYYQADFVTFDNLSGRTGQLSLMQSDGMTGLSLATPTTFSGFTIGTTYTMTLSGVYTGSDLLLTFLVTDGVTSQSISATVTDQPFASLTNFGYQQRISNWVDQTVEFDNFSLTDTPVPEPSSLALLALGVLTICRRRRGAK